jgi:hypothetical protein
LWTPSRRRWGPLPDEEGSVLQLHERLTPADHQTHRRYHFQGPPGWHQLRLRVSYSPKVLSAEASARLVAQALRRQASALASAVGEPLAQQWLADVAAAAPARVANLLTISVDDAAGTYRGAGHRQAPHQDLVLGTQTASPGLVPGPLPAGEWTLTLSVHTLVSPQCEVSIQIAADTVSSYC